MTSEKDKLLEAAVIEHLSELKTLAVDMKIYSEDEIDHVSLDDLIKFGLSYQILNLDRMMKSKEPIAGETIKVLRLYNEMAKVIVGIKQVQKQDAKLSINDPIAELRKKLHIEELK